MLKRILQYIVILILLTPLVLHLGFYQPYITGKYFYLAILLLISLPLVVYFFCQKKELWRSGIFRITFIFFLIICLINIFSLDPWRSWWGDWQRMEGLLYFILWPIFLAGLLLVFDQQKNWWELLRINALVVIVICLIAYGQWLNWPGLEDVQAERVYALIGNANFLAHYLLLNFWLAVAAYYYDHRYRYGYLILSLIILPVIYQTGSRAAFLVLVVTILAWSVYLIKIYWLKQRSKAIISIICLLLFLSVGFYFTNERFKRFSWSDATWEARLVAWQAGWEGFKEKPLLGWGRNNFHIPFNKYADFKIYRDSNSPLWFDKAHNQVVDYSVENGIFGILAYLLFLIWPFLYWRKIREKYSPQLSLALFLGLIANFIFLLANFDTLVSWLIYFIYLGFIHWLAQPLLKENKLKLIAMPLAISVVISVVGLFYLVYQPALANWQLKRIYLAPQQQAGWQEVEQAMAVVKKQAPQYQADLVLTLGTTIEQIDWPIRQRLDALAVLAKETKTAVNYHLLDAKLHYLFANTNLRIGQLAASKDNLLIAKDYYEQVLPYLTPLNRPDFVYNLAQTYYELSFFDDTQKEELLNNARTMLEANAARFPDNQDAQEKLKIFLDHQ